MKKRALWLVLTLGILLALGTFSAVSYAADYTEPTLVVTYNDATTTTTEYRHPFPSSAMHFDVYGPGAIVAGAVLYLPDGTTVNWEGNGSENADLSGCANAYWHWIYTPSGILTISHSYCDTPGCHGTLCVLKFYDANANGVFDCGDVEIPDWEVCISGIGHVETPFILPNITPGTTFTITESTPVETCWRHTTPTSVTVTVEADETECVEFGNLCLGCGGGYTIGFWTNKNGENAMNGMPTALGVLSGLNLKDAAGSDFDPAAYSNFRDWLRNANAENMQYMLSAQLAAMKLNVMWGSVDEDSLVYAPGVGVTDYITIEELMNAANAALGDPDSSRDYLEALKNALDNANNNMTFVQPAPCPFSFL